MLDAVVDVGGEVELNVALGFDVGQAVSLVGMMLKALYSSIEVGS